MECSVYLGLHKLNGINGINDLPPLYCELLMLNTVAFLKRMFRCFCELCTYFACDVLPLRFTYSAFLTDQTVHVFLIQVD